MARTSQVRGMNLDGAARVWTSTTPQVLREGGIVCDATAAVNRRVSVKTALTFRCGARHRPTIVGGTHVTRRFSNLLRAKEVSCRC